MLIICLDLEGVLIPEIWIKVAEKTGIEDLKLTTRDISDYDELMHLRIETLKKEGIRLSDIKEVINLVNPLEGAENFLRRLRKSWPVVILSDTFYQFASPIMKKLDYPTLLCNSLSEGEGGFINDYHLRQEDGKRIATIMFQRMALKVYAAGDSHNDLNMLKVADRATLFRAPEKIRAGNPKLHQTDSYEELFDSIRQFAEA